MNRVSSESSWLARNFFIQFWCLRYCSLIEPCGADWLCKRVRCGHCFWTVFYVFGSPMREVPFTQVRLDDSFTGRH